MSMNITQLESFKLADAVKFHDKLNPKLFANNKPRPEVKRQLLIIAKDFISELGIKDLAVQDITISGSNAAYTYTPHSDLDLHILVDMSTLSNDEVYKELFNAKKTLYNDTHDIKIHGVLVELYVQDSNQPVISLGEYSLLKNKWLRIPVKRRASFDENITKSKYNKLHDLIQVALKSSSQDKVSELLKTMRRYRQVGLDKAGEFSPENLAYKALRSQGWLTKLYKLRDELHSKSLSIENIQESKDVLQFKKLLKTHVFEYKDIPTLEEYNNNRQIRENFTQRVFRYCWENKESVNYSDIIRQIQTKIWKTKLTEGSNISRHDINKFIKSLWQPIPSSEIKTGMVVDTLSVQHKTDNIISLSTSENKTISQIYKQPDGNIIVKFTDGNITISNWEDVGHTTDVYFFTDSGAATKGIEWIIISSDRVKGLRKYKDFLIDLPNEGPYDRLMSKLKEQLDVKTLSPEQLSKHHNVSIDHISAQLAKGIKVELEHTNDKKVAKEIALDHLKEDPNYYTKLLKANLEENVIQEGISPIVYHYTRCYNAKKILSTGEFQLSSTLGSVEEQYAPKGYPYFLSTTRSRRGGYHDTIGSDAVLFVLDGTWYSRHYKGAPVDYWQNRDPTQSHHRAHEAEDRIFSKDPQMSIGGVKEIHIYVSPDAEEKTKAWARQDLILAKQFGIQAYFYTDKEAWRNQDTRKLGDVSILKGQSTTRGYVSTHKGYLLPWIELLKANDKSQLSKKANEIRYSLSYSRDNKSMAQGLANDLSNARKPDLGPDREHAVKIIRYMQANKLTNVMDLINNLSDKWKSVEKVTEGASGYIPSESEKNDPRYSTALTVDVKPDTIKKNAKAFGFKVSRAGIPPLLRK